VGGLDPGTLPWRIAVILGVGAADGVFGSLLAPRLGLILSGLAATAAGWGLRFRPSLHAVARRRGAAGGRRAPPDCSANWSGTGAWSYTTWRFLGAEPISTT
jgi:hypothetical protein